MDGTKRWEREFGLLGLLNLSILTGTSIFIPIFCKREHSVSHRDAGVNYGKSAGPDSYLLDANSNDSSSLKLHPLSDIKWYDFCFRKVFTNRIVRSPDKLRSVLQSVQKNDTVIVISLYRVSETIVRNFLCHIERLNIRNYIFIVPTSLFLLDLARRGHPVIDKDQLYDPALAKSFKFQNTMEELTKEILVEAFVTKRCLELGYSTWLLNGNMIPLARDLFLNSFEQTNYFVIGKSYRLLFVRSSSPVLKIWVEDFIHEAATLVNTRRKDSVPHDSSFFYAVEKLLRQKSIKYNSTDETQLGVDINIADAKYQTSPGIEKKFAFWSSETELDIIQRQLVQLRLWVVDDESSCTAVICHPTLHFLIYLLFHLILEKYG